MLAATSNHVALILRLLHVLYMVLQILVPYQPFAVSRVMRELWALLLDELCKRLREPLERDTGHTDQGQGGRQNLDGNVRGMRAAAGYGPRSGTMLSEPCAQGGVWRRQWSHRPIARTTASSTVCRASHADTIGAWNTSACQLSERALPGALGNKTIGPAPRGRTVACREGGTRADADHFSSVQGHSQQLHSRTPEVGS